MSMTKEHIDNKVEELAEALDMPFDTMMDWFIIKVVNSEEDLGRRIKCVAEFCDRTYDDVFDYVLLCMALMPDRDPVDTALEFLTGDYAVYTEKDPKMARPERRM